MTQCSDTVDNDGDGQIDYPADTGCYGSDDMTESAGTTIRNNTTKQSASV